MSKNMSVDMGLKDGKIFGVHPKMANRHGLIAGATGTGKTTTLKVMAEQFSDIGVPVFMADVKGDLSGCCVPGSAGSRFMERMEKIGFEDFSFGGFPLAFWDMYGETGHPVRTTVSEMGPQLLSRLMDLSDTQTGVLYMVFKIADDMGLLLLDYKDLSRMIRFVADNSDELRAEYGNIATQSIGAIQRSILVLEETDASIFFGEPALKIKDLMRKEDGKGVINILNSTKLMQSPTLYSTFLLWLLSELFEELDEVGDPDKPRIAFFFDEAHLLFKDTPKILIEKVEQVVRLIRSKGVGVYFITQSPLDVPESVLGQLGNRIQHALRAYTPKDQKAVRTTAQTFRQNPNLDLETIITELAVGEAIVSFLDEDGAPSVAERVWILPPKSAFGPADDADIKKVMDSSPMSDKYDVEVDRESAYEILMKKAEKASKKQEEEDEKIQMEIEAEKLEKERKSAEKERIAKQKEREKKRRAFKSSALGKSLSSAGSTFGRELGKSVVRGILGSLK
jgi:uncharacterized protein